MRPSSSGGYKLSLEITREHARSFYFCSLLLDKEKRMAAYSVYAFARMMDDNFDRGSRGGTSDLEAWRGRIDSIYGTGDLGSPVFSALRETVGKYDIPARYFLELVSGMEMDLLKKEYRDFPELYEYCYRVAGVIGLIMIRIFGYSDEEALTAAEKMGVAMQLTNILRDIKEDLDMGRVYLPAEELERFGLSGESLRNRRIDRNFREFMGFQVQRARSFYGQARSGLELIPDPNSRFIAGLMGVIYSGILDSIENNGYDVFSRRHYVPFPRKILLSLGELIKNRAGR